MATRTGFFHSNILDENDTYYPLLTSGITGMNSTGVNADLKYDTGSPINRQVRAVASLASFISIRFSFVAGG